MLSTYSYPKFPYVRPDDLNATATRRHPVVIVGAGPVGIAAAIDCRLQGLPVVLLDDDDTVSLGSRGVCYAKRTLEVLDRLGFGDVVTEKGVSWNVGRTFFGDREVYNFRLVSEPGHKRPGMVNLQQYYLEDFGLQRLGSLGVVPRWKNKVIGVESASDHVVLRVETPDGVYALEADWLIAADGARSPVRRMLGHDVEGRIFTDRFLIADVVMKAEFPAERWFWFDPPFHPNQSVLLHRQADNVWRIDFQLGWEADPEAEKKPENVIPRIRAMLGDDRDFELEWISVYTFQCRRMGSFRHDRVIFVGDAAHQVSPFGARGANSGIQDVDNLGWKLALVIRGVAPQRLLDSYSLERVDAADENILNSTRSTSFITPKSNASRSFRRAVLELSEAFPFARRLVNSGRLSLPTRYDTSPLNTPDAEAFASDQTPGAPMTDGPVGGGGWLIDLLGGRFQMLYFVDEPATIPAAVVADFRAMASWPVPVETLIVCRHPGEVPGIRTLLDAEGRLFSRYDARSGTSYLARPDQHVAARWRDFGISQVAVAVGRATARDQGEP